MMGGEGRAGEDPDGAGRGGGPMTPPLRAAFVRFVQLVVVTVAIGIVAWRFVAIDAASDSASDTLRPWLLQAGLVAAGAVLLLAIAERGSGARGRRE